MPQNKFALARYRIIDYLLRKKMYVKTSEIVESCFAKTGFCVSKRTIQLDIEAMKHDDFLGFYAPIGYSNSAKAYYYETSTQQPTPKKIHDMRFTLEELQVIKHIFDVCKDRILQEHYLLFRNMIVKLELLTDV